MLPLISIHQVVKSRKSSLKEIGGIVFMRRSSSLLASSVMNCRLMTIQTTIGGGGDEDILLQGGLSYWDIPKFVHSVSVSFQDNFVIFNSMHSVLIK